MRGHTPRSAGRSLLSRRVGWLAAGAAAAVGAVAVLAISPAGAAGNTTEAQLALSGVTVTSSVLGGSEVGVHPGDTVDFKASALPTAGLDAIPALGPLLKDLLSPLLGQYQVVVTFPGNVPGGARTVTLGGPTTGPCAGKSDLPITFPSVGTYAFTWKVQYVLPLLLGCTTNGLSSADLNLLKGAGVALNSQFQWSGEVVVANNPPTPGLGLQLPTIQVAPSLPVVGQVAPIQVGVPALQVPVTLPTLPSLPGLGGSSGGAGSSGGGSGSAGAGGGTATAVECVPCEVMAQAGSGGGGGGAPAAPDAARASQIASGLIDSGGLHSAAPGGSGAVASPAATPTTRKHLDLAANRAPEASMPVVLAIIAILALSLVTATYARLILLRRNV